MSEFNPNKGSLIITDEQPDKPESYDELWDADPNCEHDVQPQPGGGVRCTKCNGWFCF